MILQTINYAGSKKKLLPAIHNLIKQENCKSIIDCFSGSTVVSQYLAYNNYKVWSNDLSQYSYVIATTFLTYHSENELKQYKDLITTLNHLEPIRGWFSINYGGLNVEGKSVGLDGLKKPFQMHNMTKLDAIIKYLKDNNIDDKTKNIILTGLMLSLNKLDSTMGHFSSYLKEWSDRSYNDLIVTLPILNQFKSNRNHMITKKDCFELGDTAVDFDIAYLDPPYGSSNLKMPPSRVRYKAYYHFWETLCDSLYNDDMPELFGKSLRPLDTKDNFYYNPFEDFRKTDEGEFIALNTIIDLINNLKCNKFILSYSFGNTIFDKDFIEKLGDLFKLQQIYSQEHKRNVMSYLKKTGEYINENTQGKNLEYLIVMNKR